MGTPLVALALIAACGTSFSEERAEDTPDAATEAASDSPASDDVVAPDAGDPCANQPGATEIAGLYVIGGATEDNQEPTTIVRAPLHCDGSLGTPVTLSTPFPRSFIWGGAVVLDPDRVLVFGGSHDTGGPPYTMQGLVATRDSNGELGTFFGATVLSGMDRWRFGVALNGSRAYVAGGRLPDVADANAAPPGTALFPHDPPDGLSYVYTKQLDLISFAGGTFSAKRLGADLYAPAEWLGIASVGHRLVAYGAITDGGPQDSDVYWADVDDDGELVTSWQAIANPYVGGQFLGNAVVSGNMVYLFGGGASPTSFARVDMSVTPPTLLVGTGGLTKATDGTPVALQEPRSTTARGFVYIVNGFDTVIRYAKLGEDSLRINDGPALPVGVAGASLFVF